MIEARHEESGALGDVELRDLDDRAVRLGDVWRERPCLLVFVRHFGCPACSRAVTELVSRVDEIRALGVGAAVIGPGSVADARGFLVRHRLPITDARWALLCDPEGRAFDAAGMHRSTWAAYGPAGVLAQARLAAEGFLASGPRGDTSRLGGSLLVDRSGTVVAARRSERVFDSPRGANVIDDVLRLVARESAIPL